MARIVCFGECMIELHGEAFGRMRQTFGGDTLNTAVYLARCGRQTDLQVGYATALGDDFLSDGLLQRWQDEGLDTRCVRRLSGRMPGLYQISVDAHGERRFSYWRGQSAARDYFADDQPTPLEAEAAAGAIDAFYFSGISLAILPPGGRQRLLQIARTLRERQALVAFDNNYRPRLWADALEARASYSQALAVASVALLTLDDQMLLWEETDAPVALARMLALPCAELVVKRGAAATLLRLAGQPVLEVATRAVTQVVDTTAAGDSFAGAYLAARLAGEPPAGAAAAGNALAARVVQHHGALIPLAAMHDAAQT